MRLRNLRAPSGSNLEVREHDLLRDEFPDEAFERTSPYGDLSDVGFTEVASHDEIDAGLALFDDDRFSSVSPLLMAAWGRSAAA